MCFKFLFPFYDWVAVALAIPNYDALYWLLNHNYNALNWQPFVFIGLTLLWGRINNGIIIKKRIFSTLLRIEIE